MRFRSIRLRTLLIVVGFVCALLAAYNRWFTADRHAFHRVVSRGVPKHATLAQLESVAGPSERVPASGPMADYIKRMVVADLARNTDGWREDDTWAVYYKNGNMWSFQIRDGRLVNYDPDALAKMPDPQPMTTLE